VRRWIGEDWVSSRIALGSTFSMAAADKISQETAHLNQTIGNTAHTWVTVDTKSAAFSSGAMAPLPRQQNLTLITATRFR